MSYFYVYKIVHAETGEYYFGSRKCSCLPENDTNYMGSMCTWKPDKEKLIKMILESNFKTHKDALIKETELIKEYIKDPLNRNYSLPNGDLYIHSPKEWIIKKYGEENAQLVFQKMYENNTSLWRKGNKPWNTGKHLSEEHLANIRKTWHSEKRINVMNSQKYKDKMSNSLSGEKNPMHGKTIYEVWYIKYGKEIADKKYEQWKTHQKAASSGKHYWIHNESTHIKKFIKEHELQKYLNDGWKKGQK